MELREVACEDHDRLLAQAYYSLAVAHIYLSGDMPTDAGPSTLTPEAVLSLKKTALKYYGKAKDVLMKSPPISEHSPPTNAAETNSSTSSPPPPPPLTTSSSTEPTQTPSAKIPLTEAEERKELCDEISETITALEQEIKSLEMPQSFLPSSTSFIGASTTTIGFGQPSTSAVSMLEVKRKAPATSTSNSAPSSATTVELNKKPKIQPSSEGSTVNDVANEQELGGQSAAKLGGGEV